MNRSLKQAALFASLYAGVIIVSGFPVFRPEPWDPQRAKFEKRIEKVDETSPWTLSAREFDRALDDWQALKKHRRLADQTNPQLIWQSIAPDSGATVGLISYKGRPIFLVGAWHSSDSTVRILDALRQYIARDPHRFILYRERLGGEELRPTNSFPIDHWILRKVSAIYDLPIAKGLTLVSRSAVDALAKKPGSSYSHDEILLSLLITVIPLPVSRFYAWELMIFSQEEQLTPLEKTELPGRFLSVFEHRWNHYTDVEKAARADEIARAVADESNRQMWQTLLPQFLEAHPGKICVAYMGWGHTPLKFPPAKVLAKSSSKQVKHAVDTQADGFSQLTEDVEKESRLFTHPPSSHSENR